MYEHVAFILSLIKTYKLFEVSRRLKSWISSVEYKENNANIHLFGIFFVGTVYLQEICGVLLYHCRKRK